MMLNLILFVLSLGMWFYLLQDSFKPIVLMSSSSKPIWIRLRRLYWRAARLQMKKYIQNIDNGNDLDYIRNITVVIMLYELDLAKYKDTFVLYGFNRLSLDVVTHTEKTERFVEFHKEKDYYLTAENILEKYMSEFDNQTKY